MSDDLVASAYFYTYSTIAQTLAAVLGFLVAVVLFVMQGIHRHIYDCASMLVQHSLADRARLKQLQSGSKWHEMIALHKKVKQYNDDLTSEMNQLVIDHFQEMQREVTKLDKMRKELAISMYFTAIVIIISIGAMPLTAHNFNPRNPFAIAMIIGTILAATVCLQIYLRLIYNVFS